MANPSQRDYGHEGSETPLVPGALRLYRHFKAADGELFPMNSMSGGANPYRTGGAFLGDRVYVAECRKSIGGAMWAQQVGFAATGQVTPSHGPSPSKTCQCGFYAHYEPNTDFYPDHDWNLTSGGRAFSRNQMIVKGVVEATGRVVMGTKGVRAEKIQIVALAPDWTKYRSAEWSEAIENARTYNEYRGLRDNPNSFPPSEEETLRVTQLMGHLARTYGAQLYSHPTDMHEAYPAQDVKELLEQPKKPDPQTDPYSEYRKRWML